MKSQRRKINLVDFSRRKKKDDPFDDDDEFEDDDDEFEDDEFEDDDDVDDDDYYEEGLSFKKVLNIVILLLPLYVLLFSLQQATILTAKNLKVPIFKLMN